MSATVTNIEDKRRAVSIADVFAALAQEPLGEANAKGEVRARCLSPDHPDANPSCDYNVRKNIWHCKPCSKGGGYKDLVLHAHPKIKTKAAATEWLKSQGLVLNIQQLWDSVDKTYDYVDEDGTLLYQVGRWNDPKEFRQRVPDGNGGWRFTLDNVRRVPFMLPQLLRAVRRGETIHAVEGEKDAQALYSAGYVATTSSQGAAQKWPLDWADYFKGAHKVYVIADNDDSGREAAKQRAGIIARSAGEVFVVDALPGVPKKGDVSDWLEVNDAADFGK